MFKNDLFIWGEVSTIVCFLFVQYWGEITKIVLERFVFFIFWVLGFVYFPLFGVARWGHLIYNLSYQRHRRVAAQAVCGTYVALGLPDIYVTK